MTVLSSVLASTPFQNNVGIPLVQGAISGLGFALIALGIVLIYKSNKVFNFAQAEFATMAALVAAEAHKGMQVAGLFRLPPLPLWLCLLMGLLAGTGTAVLVERLVIRPLFDAARTTLLVATVGVALGLFYLDRVVLSPDPAPLPVLDRQIAFTLLGYRVQDQDVVLALVLAVLGVGSVLFFRSRAGLAILAVSQEPTAAATVGISVSRISLLTWTIAGVLASLAGLVLGPTYGSAPGQFTFTGPLVSGFVAAVLGGMTSLPGAFVGGIVLGIVESVGGHQLQDAIPGASDVATAAVLLLVLLVRPKGILGKEA